jgi:ABC-type Fe2+-enterobactin transport system substrate-binding protein
VNRIAHKPKILKGLPAGQASNPVWLRGPDTYRIDNYSQYRFTVS